MADLHLILLTVVFAVVVWAIREYCRLRLQENAHNDHIASSNRHHQLEVDKFKALFQDRNADKKEQDD